MTRLAIQPLDLAGRFIFLSASIPSGDRATQDVEAPPWRRCRCRRCHCPGRSDRSRSALFFGGHPTISPLVLMVQRECSARDPSRVMIYQSGCSPRW